MSRSAVPLTLVLMASAAPQLDAQDRLERTRVEGIVSFDVSRQNVIGGSLVRGMDILQQAVRSVTTVRLAVGWCFDPARSLARS